MIPRAEHAELPGEHGQREHRPERRATVAVPLDPPSDADERGADRCELLGERGDVGGGTPVTSAVRSSVQSAAAAILVRASRVRLDERPVDEIVSARCRTIPSTSATSVPGRSARCRSARRAIAVRRGSTTTSRAPSARARCTSGGKWMFEIAGFAPQTMTSRLCTTSCGSADSIDPNVDCHAAPAVAAQIVWRTRAAPSSSNRRHVSPSAASSPADEVVEVGNDRRRAVLCDRGRDARRHEVERFIPRGRPELTQTLRPHPHQWRHHSLGRVHPPACCSPWRR